MYENGEPPKETSPSPESPTSEDEPRYAFTVPDVEPNIEFKSVRRSRTVTEPAKRRRLPRFNLRAGLRKRHLVTTALVLVAALVLGAGWAGFVGYRAADHLSEAQALFTRLEEQVRSGDVSAARTTLTKLQREVKDARSATSGVTWRVASSLPGGGDDLAAVRTITAALDDLVTKGLPPLVDVAAALEAVVLAPADGQVDLTALRAAGPKLAEAQDVIRQARERVSAIHTAGLAQKIKSAVPTLVDGLQRAEKLAGPTQRAMKLVPPMLGADGPRTYLVLFQNLAEVRATGGMPGAYVVVQADHGKIQIIDQGTAAGNLRTFESPVLPLDPDMEDLHTNRLGIFPADVNLTPDFPTAAALAREMYRVRAGRTVDGVLATDPVALSYLLRATGPVAMSTGDPLTAETAVRRLLSDVYASFPEQAQQDAFFAEAARAVFDALIGRKGDPRLVLSALTRAVGERRILMWSANAEEQAEISTFSVAGTMPKNDGGAPAVGVFLNDGTGAKLSYYLTHSATLSVGGCMEDNTVELRLKVVLGTTAPDSGLSASVLGLSLAGPYTTRTNVMVYTPTGGSVVDVSQDGQPADVGLGVELERGVAVASVDLPPGGTKTLDFTLLTDVLPPNGGKVTPRLLTSPGVTPWTSEVNPGQGCTT